MTTITVEGETLVFYMGLIQIKTADGITNLDTLILDTFTARGDIKGPPPDRGKRFRRLKITVEGEA